MDGKELLDRVNQKIAYRGEQFELAGVPTGTGKRISVPATFRGHAVRIEFEDIPSDGDYRFSATVYDGSTGDLIATGNGGSTWGEAFDIVHWQELDIRFPA